MGFSGFDLPERRNGLVLLDSDERRQALAGLGADVDWF